jgi:RNA exonuclease NGL2
LESDRPEFCSEKLSNTGTNSVFRIGLVLLQAVSTAVLACPSNLPIIVDFNFPPDDPAYSLLVGEPLSIDQQLRLMLSRVVHISIDPTVPKTTKQSGDEEDEDNDPDRIITNARPASPSDGLLTSSELLDLYSICAPLRSVYDKGLRTARALRLDVRTFGDRVSHDSTRPGAHEPEWTCYAHYWKTGLGT